MFGASRSAQAHERKSAQASERRSEGRPVNQLLAACSPQPDAIQAAAAPRTSATAPTAPIDQAGPAAAQTAAKEGTRDQGPGARVQGPPPTPIVPRKPAQRPWAPGPMQFNRGTHEASCRADITERAMGELLASPGKAVEPTGPKPPDAITLDDLVKAFRNRARRATHSVIYCGQVAYGWIKQPEHQADRAAAIRAAEQRLRAEGLHDADCRVNRMIACYKVARLACGPKPEQLEQADAVAYSTLRRLTVLIMREAGTETWSVVPAYRDAFAALWRDLIAQHLTGDQVDERIQQIRGGKKPRRRPLAFKTQLKRIFREVARLDRPSLEELMARIRAQLESGDEHRPEAA